MKKLLSICMTMAATTIIATSVFAGNYFTSRGAFTDANGDGICDNRGSNCMRFTDENGDGICDNRGTNRNSNRCKCGNGFLNNRCY